MKISAYLKKKHGYSFVELVVVLVILAIISVIIISRYSTAATNLGFQTETLKAHLRHSQSKAMGGTDSTDIFGIKCDTNFYWLFKGTDPDSNIAKLLDDPSYDTNNDGKLSLSAKKIAIATAFTVFFDDRGIPYSTYTDETSNTPFASDLPVNVQPAGAASPTRSITITQHTGFIP
jgi:prepilin-type N-terminal cleavage/methylation domain-containing protein